jgi:hypothetical protein
MGLGAATIMPTVVLRLVGQVSIGPSGVDDQSNERISPASSLAPSGNLWLCPLGGSDFAGNPIPGRSEENRSTKFR